MKKMYHYLATSLTYKFINHCYKGQESQWIHTVYSTMRLLRVFTFLELVVRQNVEANNYSKFLEPEKISNVLSSAVIKVTVDMYVKYTPVINFALASSSEAGKNSVLETIQEVVAGVDANVTVSIEDHNHMVKVRRKRVFNVFFVNGYESFTKIYQNLSTVIYDYQGFFIIVVTQPEKSIKRIFEDLWYYYITNANVVTLNSHNLNEANIFTYFPFTDFHCEKVEPELYDIYTIESGFKFNLTYFPKKVSNLHGCPLSVATFYFPPFVLLSRDDNGLIKLDGLDGFLITIISKTLNFTLDIVQVTEDNLWGILYENGSSIGTMKMVMDGVINSTIGYYTLSQMKFQLLSASNAYYTSSLAWMVPPGSELTSLNIIIKPFDLGLWILVIAVFLISMLVVVFIKKSPLTKRNFIIGKNVSSPSLNILNICLGGPLVRIPTRNFARTLLCIFMLCCITIRCSYQGALFKFMKMNPKEPIADTFYEMLDRN